MKTIAGSGRPEVEQFKVSEPPAITSYVVRFQMVLLSSHSGGFGSEKYIHGNVDNIHGKCIYPS